MDSGDNLSAYLVILAKRWWLILLLMVVAGGTTAFRLTTDPPSYAAATRLRVTAPEPGEVAIYTPLSRADVRKEVEYVKNDFVEIATGPDTAWRTAAALNREVDGVYIHANIKVTHSPDSDFVTISAKANTPELAEKLANTHADTALAYFGEIRAKPITGIRKFLRDEMTRALKDIDGANKDLQDFRNKNKVGTVDDEINSYRSLITSLRLERDSALGKDDKATAGRLDVIISSHEERLVSLIALTSEYRSLISRVGELESTYGRLLSKETEAKLKEEQARNVGFIQVVEPARGPNEPSSQNLISFTLMSVVAAMLLGFMLSFLIEYLGTGGTEKAPDGEVVVAEGLGAQ